MMNRTLALIAVGVLAVGSAQAAEKDAKDTRWRSDRGATEVRHEAASSVIRASHLMGMPVKNRQEEMFGDVKDAAIDTSEKAVAYVVVSVGGFLGMGDKMVAIPWTELQVKQDRNGQPQELVWDRTKRDLERVEGFDQNNWPQTVARPATMDRHEDRERRGERGEIAQGDLRMDAKLSDLRGMKVSVTGRSSRDRDDRSARPMSDLGTAQIDDLVIDTSEGRLGYAILSVDDVRNLDFDTALVPISLLTIHGQSNTARLDATLRQLAQSEFRKRDWQQLAERTYGERVYGNFGEKPYWQTSGQRDVRDRGEGRDMAQPQVARASHLIGLTVKNRQGESLGELRDAAVDASEKAIVYAVVGFGGGIFRRGENLVAVPWQDLKFSSDRAGKPETAVWDKTRREMQQMQGFDSENWPQTATLSGRDTRRDAERDMDIDRDEYTERDRRVDTNRRSEPGMGGRMMAQDLRMDCKLSDLRGMKVSLTGATTERARSDRDPAARSAASMDMGKAQIDDVVVDTNEGRLAYVILSVDDVRDLDFDTAIVPISALTIQPQQRTAQITASMQQLAQSEFHRRDWNRLAEAEYGRRVYENFGEEPYWQTYGYREAPDKDRKDPAKYTNEGWKHESQYNRSFDARNVKTYKGRITSVGQFQPDKKSLEGREVRLRTSDGKELIVHLGPSRFIEEQKFELKDGAEVTVQGAEATIDGKKVIIGTSIQSGNRTVQLRDRAGKGQWDVDKWQKDTPNIQR